MPKLFDAVMRVIATLIGLLMLLSGIVWTMQGLGIGPDAIMRSFMANDVSWAIYGSITAVIGLCLIIWSNRRHHAAR